VAFREDVTVSMIEVGPNPLTLELSKPSPTPEALEIEKADFPYLKPVAGVTSRHGFEDKSPFWVQLPVAPQPEMIAEQVLVRDYGSPPGLSNLQFVTTYREALVKASWDIVSEHNSADAQIIAHYSKQGRDLWAKLHLGGQHLSIAVADRGSDLKADLAKECHVALYGLFFDFNKSALQPASDPVLEKLLALLKKNASLKLEVQGHTDNVGDAAYNQTLSEARAATVVKWLEARGVAANRLSSRGYGKAQPVADNGTDIGRAKNRRVEIADPHCKPKGK
jgi:OOP family OmpA-OmpF porin